VHPPERVFVSYSHESEAHDALVLSLAEQLWADGVMAFCDQYTTAPAEGWPRWMEQQIAEADFVLIVCTKTYNRKLSQHTALGVGKGVIWEASLIYQLIYESATSNSRFIPILLPGATAEDIPTPLRSATYYRVTPPFSTKENGYEDLYRRITNQPRVKVPALGPRQALVPTTAQRPTLSPAIGTPPQVTAEAPTSPAASTQSQPQQGKLARKAGLSV
jgi:SEFIR domain